jgi:hypothetical protein
MYVIGIKRLSDTDEWKVTHVNNGDNIEERAYYTDDKKDAAATAALEYVWAREQGLAPSFSKGALTMIRKYGMPF